jgi:AraC-like DNA-binding protein
MQYSIYKSDIFQDLIDCFWILEFNGDDDKKIYTPANQYLNIIFAPDNGYIRNNCNVQGVIAEGISQYTTKYNYSNNSRVVGIRFSPYGLYPFLNRYSYNRVNQSTELLYGTCSLFKKFAQEISRTDNHTRITELLSEFVSELYCKKRYSKTESIKHAYRYLRDDNREVSVSDLTGYLSCSYSTLGRYFKEVTGLSTKSFERLIKFRKSLCSLTSNRYNLTTIGNNAGYYDQSHFIREFELFTNYSPKDYRLLLTKSNRPAINYNFDLI